MGVMAVGVVLMRRKKAGSHGPWEPWVLGWEPWDQAVICYFNGQKRGLGLTKKGTAYFVILIIGNGIIRSSN